MEINQEKIFAQIQEAKQGKQSAFNYLLDNYWSYVYGYLLQRTNNEIDAEDYTIQAFAKAFAKIHQFKEEYSFKTWIVTIAKNIHYDEIRKGKNKINAFNNHSLNVVEHIADESPTAEDILIREQKVATLLSCIKKLKPHYQKVLVLRYFQEMPIKQIAIEINEAESNVKVKLLRARKLLTEIITDKSSFYS